MALANDHAATLADTLLKVWTDTQDEEAVRDLLEDHDLPTIQQLSHRLGGKAPRTRKEAFDALFVALRQR